MNRREMKWFAVFLSLAIGGAANAGIFSRTGLLGVGSRSMGMGGAFVAVADDASAHYWNPAGMVQLTNLELSGMYGSLKNGKSRYTTLAAVLPGLKGAACGASMVLYQSTEGAKSSENQLGASFALPLDSREILAVGASFRYLFGPSDVALGKVSGRSIDFGLHARLPLPREQMVKLGLLVSDLESSLRWGSGLEEDVRRMVNLGLAYYSPYATLLALDYGIYDAGTNANAAKNVFRSGLEHWFFNRSWGLRAGYVSFQSLKGQFSMGTSYLHDVWSFDYAFMGHSGDLGSSHRLTLSYSFPRMSFQSPVSARQGAGGASGEELAALRQEMKKIRQEQRELAQREFASVEEMALLKDELTREKGRYDRLLSETKASESHKQREKAAVEDKQAMVRSHSESGLSAFRKGEYLMAVSEFKLALHEDPDNRTIREHLREAINQVAPSELYSGEMLAVYQEGIRYHVEGDFEREIEMWERMLKEYPLDIRIQENLEEAKLKSKKIRELE